MKKYKYNMGGQAWMNLAQQIPQLSDALIGLFEGGSYSKQPTLNADTMRQMVTPYAFGGQVDEEQLAQLQDMADQYGLSIEELLAELQNLSSDQVDSESISTNDETTIPEDEEEAEFVEQFAYGGRVKSKGKVPIEVEGDEILETPDGNLSKVKGPSHEAGGIDINVPPGTKIFSDRLKIDGQTMQERKVKREKALARIEKMLNTNPTDKITRGSYDRTLEVNKAEEMKDMALQKMMNAIYNAGTQPQEEFAYGGTVKNKYPYGGYGGDFYEPIPTNPLFQDNNLLNLILEQQAVNDAAPAFKQFMSTRKQANPVTSKDNNAITDIGTSNFGGSAGEDNNESQNGFTGNLSLGDWVGLGGNLFNAIAPIVNTRNMASNMKPNINRYLGFGNDALEANQSAQDAAQRSKASQLDDIETSANSARARTRNSVSSLNTLRALDTVTDMQTTKARQGAYDSFSNTMMNLMGQRAQLENMQDRFEMAGATQRDIEDKADMDNYYSNMAQNLVNFGSNIQGVGRALNINKANKVDARLLSQLSQYGLGIDDDGNLITQK